MLSLGFLFTVCFLAATFVPIPSELYYLYELSTGRDFYLTLTVASLGNTLGSIVNYLIGFFAISFALKFRLLSQQKYQKGVAVFDKWGAYSLLLTWVPLLGSAIMLASGAAKYKWYKYLAIVLVAKTLRYLIVGYGYLGITSA